MNVGALTLRHLCFTGERKAPALVQFGHGLNVISGASETGKSFIFESIDFMLGSGAKLRDIPERVGYDRVFLGIEDSGGQTFTLERSASGGEFRCYQGLFTSVPADVKPTVLSAKHNPRNDENVSRFLLQHIGLAGKKLRKNANGDANSLSFRNLTPLILISEGDIQKQGSPIETGQFVSKTLEFSAYKLLLTGVDDTSLQAVRSSKDETLARTAKIEIIDELLSSYRERLVELVGEEDSEIELRAQVERLDQSLSREKLALQNTESNYREIVDRRSKLRRSLEGAQERRAEITELLERFKLLDQHYRSDLERLKGIREAGVLASALNPQSCPLCGAPPREQHLNHECDGNIDKIVAATDTETDKIVKLRGELNSTTDKLRGEADTFDRDMPEARGKLSALEAQFAEQSPIISEKRVAYEELVEKRSAVVNALNVLSAISDLEARKGGTPEAQDRSGSKAEGTTDISVSVLDEFSTVLERILKAWNFPGAARVYFDKETRDFVIASKPRGSRGKGLRAITHAAFTIALLEFTWKKNLPHPGFVVLDTPLLAYREPEGEEDDLTGTDVQDRFYEYLNAHRERQVIVLENVDPPADVKALDRTILFSQNPHHGRVGFFPVTDKVTGGQTPQSDKGEAPPVAF